MQCIDVHEHKHTVTCINMCAPNVCTCAHIYGPILRISTQPQIRPNALFYRQVATRTRRNPRGSAQPWPLQPPGNTAMAFVHITFKHVAKVLYLSHNSAEVDVRQGLHSAEIVANAPQWSQVVGRMRFCRRQ